MKAYIRIDPNCPECGHAMWIEFERAAVKCINPDCSKDGKRYEIPQIELRPLEGE